MGPGSRGVENEVGVGEDVGVEEARTRGVEEPAAVRGEEDFESGEGSARVFEEDLGGGEVSWFVCAEGVPEEGLGGGCCGGV